MSRRQLDALLAESGEGLDAVDRAHLHEELGTLLTLVDDAPPAPSPDLAARLGLPAPSGARHSEIAPAVVAPHHRGAPGNGPVRRLTGPRVPSPALWSSPWRPWVRRACPLRPTRCPRRCSARSPTCPAPTSRSPSPSPGAPWTGPRRGHGPHRSPSQSRTTHPTTPPGRSPGSRRRCRRAPWSGPGRRPSPTRPSLRIPWRPPDRCLRRRAPRRPHGPPRPPGRRATPR